jgi:hypothetical protein
MKYITLIIGLLVVGCGKQEQTDANKSTPTTNTNEVSGTTEKPVKELTKEDVVGTYEAKKDGRTEGVIFLENGVIESYENGKKRELEAKWTIINGEIHGEVKNGRILVFSINKDKSVTNIAVIDKDGEREDFPKEEAEQATMKKIK